MHLHPLLLRRCALSYCLQVELGAHSGTFLPFIGRETFPESDVLSVLKLGKVFPYASKLRQNQPWRHLALLISKTSQDKGFRVLAYAPRAVPIIENRMDSRHPLDKCRPLVHTYSIAQSASPTETPPQTAKCNKPGGFHRRNNRQGEKGQNQNIQRSGLKLG
jgi:hypothetical protein